MSVRIIGLRKNALGWTDEDVVEVDVDGITINFPRPTSGKFPSNEEIIRQAKRLARGEDGPLGSVTAL